MASHISDSERRPSSATELPDKRSCIASTDAVLDHPSNFEASFPSESSCEADQNHRLLLKDTAEPYEYLPLERDHIRILALLPGHVGEPLSGRLVHCSLSQPPEYTALSYYWGAPVLSEAVLLPQTLQITATLHYALSRMRDPENAVAVWADAVCIDQNNTSEKEIQISYMGQIYSNAETTSIELGPEADQSEVVGAWVKAYSEIVEIVSAADKTEIPTEFDLEDPICSVLFPHLYASIWTSLTDLLLRPWFLRVWIMQEVIYSQKLYISCGAWTLRWEEFSNAIVSYMAQLASLNQPGPWEQEVRFKRERAAKQIGTLSKLRRQSYAEWDEKYEMIFMLKLLSGTHATEPCDYFFGILGLCKEKDDPSLQPNYAHSYADTSLRWCKSFISRGQVFDILNGTSPSAWAAELPSWIPDWRAGKLSEFRSFIEGMGGGDWHYQAAAKEVAKVYVREHSCELVIEGFVFDRIRKIGAEHADSHSSQKEQRDQAWEKFSRYLAEAQSLYGGERDHRIDDENLKAAKATTIVQGLHREVYSNGARKFPKEMQHIAAKQVKVEEFHAAFLNAISKDSKDFLDDNEQTLHEYLEYMEQIFRALKLCVTQQGRLGQVPLEAHPGDVVAIIYGGPVPYLLRPCRGNYQVVGPCYIYGTMNGEVLEGCERTGADVLTLI